MCRSRPAKRVTAQIEQAVSDDILNEVGRVLRDKFTVPAEDVEEYRNQVLVFANTSRRWSG